TVSLLFSLFSLPRRPPPISTLFPYTTLFRSRAIAYSIDYDKYIEILSENTNLRANSILVPGIAGYLPAKDFRFRYDPVLAKEYRSEEHTSELQSRENLVCRLLLEKKKRAQQ